ncbi:undecaprenyldiphospho-muramoylpentapeptide beta-N-acetylglucosaminyltransferase [Paucilactobacillus sp. N302-9]
MRLMVSGGGTGGHIYPALALIERLKQVEPNSEVLYVGTHRGLENKIVPAAHIELKTIQIQGFKRSLSLDNFKTLFLFLKSIKVAKKMIRDFKPDVVLGTGGYVSGSVLYAAAKMGIPTVIHEQNSVVGITNKFLSRYVDKIAISFDAAKNQFPEQKVVKTGNPRGQQVVNRKSDFSWQEFGLEDDRPTMLIFGGSQGAPKINSSVVEAIPEFNQRAYQIVFATGQKRFETVQAQLKDQSVNHNIVIKPYISNMPDILPKVSVIVGRAGATSIAELTALGIPSILIPSPYVTANHQVKNAQSLVNVHAAEMILEDDLSGQKLVTVADKMMQNEDLRREMSQNAKQVGIADASDELIELLKEAIKLHP